MGNKNIYNAITFTLRQQIGHASQKRFLIWGWVSFSIKLFRIFYSRISWHSSTTERWHRGREWHAAKCLHSENHNHFFMLRLDNVWVFTLRFKHICRNSVVLLVVTATNNSFFERPSPTVRHVVIDKLTFFSFLNRCFGSSVELHPCLGEVLTPQPFVLCGH